MGRRLAVGWGSATSGTAKSSGEGGRDRSTGDTVGSEDHELDQRSAGGEIRVVGGEEGGEIAVGV